MILAFAHPCVVVPDLERATRFYEHMFGFEVIGEVRCEPRSEANDGTDPPERPCRGHMMRGHNCFLELLDFSERPGECERMPYPNARELGIRHLAFYVDDCWAEYERLQRLGGTAMGVPAGDEEGGYAVYCRDPFGNIIELAEIPALRVCPTMLPGIDRLGSSNDRL